MARLVLRRMGLVVCCVSFGWACSVFNPLDAYGPPGPKSAEGGTDAATTDAPIGVDPCARSRPPARPGTGMGNEDLKLVFAVDSLFIGAPTADGGPDSPLGYDLDGVCTCPGPPSCIAPPSTSGSDAGPRCDAPGGIDNSGTELMLRIVRSAGSASDATDKIKDGSRGLVIQVADYDGSANDPNVVVTFFTSGGTNRDINGDRIPPRHDGTDAWTLDREALLGGSGPPFVGKYRDDTAYVANGTLVAATDFPLVFGTLVAELTGTLITAKIGKRGAQWRLDEGRFVGRWPTRKLLTALDTIKDPFVPDGTLCGTSQLYLDLKKELCAVTDLFATPGQDNGTSACNAVGMMLSFGAESAILGDAANREAVVRKCGDAWTDECTR